MMFRQNPTRLLWLIAACLLLLGLSQVLWINREWREQKKTLQQEANYLFQRTMMGLQDSLLRRNMQQIGLKMPEMPPLPVKQPVWEGATAEVHTETRIQLKRTPGTFFPPKQDTADKIQIILAESDSMLNSAPGRVYLNFQADSLHRSPQNFVFELQKDTISSEALKKQLTIALKGAGKPATFILYQVKDPAEIPPEHSMATEPAPTGLFRQQSYVMALQEYKGYLVKKLLPYVLFSVFLFSLTSVAFGLIFNNLKQQQRLDRQKSEFISNVTHELKTPLTTVGVALEALHDFEVLRHPEKTREYLHISKQELNRLHLLVEKVLRLSMFEQHALELKLEKHNLTDTVQQVVSAMSLQAAQLGATIQVVHTPGACWVSGDPLHLSGVVYNLLDNALKYRRGMPEVVVSLEHELSQGRAVIQLRVTDNGIGIAPEYQTQVFEKFFRVPSNNTHNVKGHGLGLSYVAHVVQAHGGHIRVESLPEVGSTFIVEIPAATPPPTA
jgi:two-component system, OmpR family, phosphate regulon sensor histidine kinase PhoR